MGYSHLSNSGMDSPLVSLGTRPSKNRKGGPGKWAWVEVYTVPGMQAHFQLAFDQHSEVLLLEMQTTRKPSSCFASFQKTVNTKWERLELVQQKAQTGFGRFSN